jgi:hypothetical protein
MFGLNCIAAGRVERSPGDESCSTLYISGMVTLYLLPVQDVAEICWLLCHRRVMSKQTVINRGEASGVIPCIGNHQIARASN